MEVKELYRYQRADGGISVSPVKPEGDYVVAYRLIADEGKVLTNNGKDVFEVLDTNSPVGWYEIDKPEESEELENV